MKARVFALLLCVTLLCGIWGGCSNTGTTTSSVSTTTTKATSQQATTTTTATTEKVREEISLDMFVMSGAAAISGVWEDWCSQKLLEDLNIRLNIWPTGAEVETKMRSYIAADSMPDFIGFNDRSIAQEAVDAGRLLKLNDYSSSMPNIFENDMFQQAVRYYTKYLSDGTDKNMYIVPAGVGPSAFNSFIWVPLLQWGAYRDAGYPVLNTFEDYLSAFEQMLEVKPLTENGEKVYALSLRPGFKPIAELSYFYGIALLGNIMEANVITREIKPLTAEDSFFKRALQFVFNANQKGMLDPDSLTQGFDDVTGKISAGRALFSQFSWWTGTYNQESSGRINNKDNPDALLPIVANDMKIYRIPETTIGGTRMFAISSKSQNIERTTEFLNWLYDISTAQYIHTGPEGLLWEMINGRPTFTQVGKEVIGGADVPLPGGGQLPASRSIFNTLGQTDGTIVPYTGDTLGYWSWRSYLEENPSLAKLQYADRYGSLILEDYLSKNNMIAESTMAIDMVPPISKELELTATSIKEMMDTYAWQIVMAESQSQFDSLWDEMVTMADGLGLEQVSQYYTDAWVAALNLADEYK